MQIRWPPPSSPAHRRNSEPYSSPIKLAALSPRSFYAAGQMETPPSPPCHDENGGAEEPRDDAEITKKCDFHLMLNEESAAGKRSEGATTSNLFGELLGSLGSPPFLTVVVLRLVPRMVQRWAIV